MTLRKTRPGGNARLADERPQPCHDSHSAFGFNCLNYTLFQAIKVEEIRATLVAAYALTISREGLPDTNTEHRCTASIGVAINHHASQDIFRWADSAMYQAKATGHNVIRFADIKG